MFPRWLSKFVKWPGRKRSSAEPAGCDNEVLRRLFQPLFEQLEGRIVPSVDPFVESINRTSSAGADHQCQQRRYTVTFQRGRHWRRCCRFPAALGGTVAATLSQVTPVSGSVYTVTVSGITGIGTLGLNLVDNGSIHDSAGNPLTQQNADRSPSRHSKLSPPVLAPCQWPWPMSMGDGIPDLVVANSYGSTRGS